MIEQHADILKGRHLIAPIHAVALPNRFWIRRLIHIVLIAVVACTATQALGEEADDGEVSRTHHLDIGRRRMAYESLVGREPIRIAGTDAVRARMFYVAYRLPAREGSLRPLTIIWNGGPGGGIGSMLLGGQGPKRVEAARIVDNPDTLLDQTDLLYIDAVGSGFSRPQSVEDRALFYQTRGDVESFVECILSWRRRHGADRQPVFLSGVSWGAYRVAAVAQALAARGVPVVGGAMMVGRNGLAKPGAERRYFPLGIVHYPRIALLHGKLSKDLGSDIDAIERGTKAWALTMYLPALDRLESLSSADREAIAQRLALYSGLPLARINRRTLVVTPRDMVDGLLAVEGDQLVQFDMRQVVPRTPPPPFPRASAERYMRDELGYRSGLAYYGLVWDAQRLDGFLPVGSEISEWNYLDGYYADQLSRTEHARLNAEMEANGYPPGGQEVALAAEAMRQTPTMHMLVVHGRYDALPSSCTSAEAQLAEVEADIRSRVTFLCVDSGHGLFVNDVGVRSVINAAMRSALRMGEPPQNVAK